MTAVAVVSINHDCYLLPRTKALKVAELMGEAVNAERDWGRRGPAHYAVTGERPNVQLTMVDPSQIDLPEGVTTPAPRKAARSPDRLK